MLFQMSTLYNVEKAYVYHLNGYNFLLMQESMMGQQNWYVYSGPAKSSPYIDQQDTPQLINK